MKSAIITGANGFLGRNLLEILLANEVNVYAFVRKDINFEHSNLKVIKDDLENIYKYESFFKAKSIDNFYHLAWKGSRGLLRDDLDIQKNNFNLSVICYSFSNDIKAHRFISTGTISENLIYQFSLNPNNNITYYAIYKYLTRLVLFKYSKLFKTQIIWAKMSNLYGLEFNSDNLIPYTINSLIKNKIAEFSSATNFYDFLNVNDASKALMLLGSNNSLKKSYYVGSGRPMILKEYLKIIGRAFDKENLLKFGVRSNDNYDYDIEWFSIKDLQLDTKFNVTKKFEDYILELKEEFYENQQI